MRRVKSDPGSIDASLECQIGMWQAVQGCQSGPKCGASHAIGHILGGAYDVPHGYTSCVALPAVLAWNAADSISAVSERQRLISEVFERIGAAESLNTARNSIHRSAAEHVRGLVHELGLPETLQDIGIGLEQLDDCAKRTMGDALVHTNPRKISNWKDVREILELAVK